MSGQEGKTMAVEWEEARKIRVELVDTAYGELYQVTDLRGKNHWFSTQRLAESFLMRYRTKLMMEGA